MSILKKNTGADAEWVVPCSAVDRTIYITSQTDLHGVLGMFGTLVKMTEEERQDFCESVLEEAFFCGYDYWDDWYPLLSKISLGNVNQWLTGSSSTILLPSYDQDVFFPAMASGYNPRKILFGNEFDSKRHSQLTQQLRMYSPKREYGFRCGWDAIVSTDVPVAVVDIQIDAFGTSDFIPVPKRKLDAMAQISSGFSISSLLVVSSRLENLWLDASTLDILKLQANPCKWFANGLPSDQEVMYKIPRSLLSKFDDFGSYIQELKNVDV